MAGGGRVEFGKFKVGKSMATAAGAAFLFVQIRGRAGFIYFI